MATKKVVEHGKRQTTHMLANRWLHIVIIIKINVHAVIYSMLLTKRQGVYKIGGINMNSHPTCIGKFYQATNFIYPTHIQFPLREWDKLQAWVASRENDTSVKLSRDKWMKIILRPQVNENMCLRVGRWKEIRYHHYRLKGGNMWPPGGGAAWEVYGTFKRRSLAWRSTSLGVGSKGLPHLTSCSLSSSCVREKMWSASLLLLPPCCALPTRK